MNRDEKLEELAKHEEQYREKHADVTRTETTQTYHKKTFAQSLAVFTGSYHNDWILKDLAGPFLTLANPAACYAVLCSGLLNSWYVGSAIIISGIFSGKPWLFGAAQVGYIGAGPFLGGMIGSLLTATMGDPVIKWMTKRNNGV